MKEFEIGFLIHELRNEKGLTQEQLCEGICSLSTLSRIETGSQIPTREHYIALVERLGVSGFSFGNLVTKEDLCREILMDEIKDAIEFQDWERAQEKLWTLTQMKNAYMTELFMGWAWGMIFSRDDLKKYIQDCLDLVNNNTPKLLGNLMQPDLMISKTEILVLNTIGVGLIKLGDLEQGAYILSGLKRQIRTRSGSDRNYWRDWAIINNNLGIAYAALGRYEDAAALYRSALIAARKGGGFEIALNIYKNKMWALKLGQKEEEAQDVEKNLLIIYKEALKEGILKKDFKEFISEKDGIWVL